MLTGRVKELKQLRDAVNDERSHFIAVYGRRRIGKTFLVRECFGGRFTFYHTGIYGEGLKKELQAFDMSLKGYGLRVKKNSGDWLTAFENLKTLIKESKENKKIIFIDELSWMDTPKSGFISALEFFWNGWASARNDIVLIICASATSWMINKVIHNRGGLYNRLTDQIRLTPFSLKECEDYARENGLSFNRQQIIQGYMVMGGIPYYWSKLQNGMSMAQNIDGMMFGENALLKDEFSYLYASIFHNPRQHIKIIEALGTKKAGMTREEIIGETGIMNSGDLTIKLDELINCGFIKKYNFYGNRKKDTVYQLVDLFTLFYFKFIKKSGNDSGNWLTKTDTPEINTWQGLAFERVCFMHIREIKKKLGIDGVQSDVMAWQAKPDTANGIAGAQIDMLIVRKDQIINMCEMKYSESEYRITGKYDRELRSKAEVFCQVTGTKYAVHPVLITTYGLINNEYSDYIQNTVVMDDLFVR